MLYRFLILFAVSVLAFCAEDSWTKVRELKSGTEVRIYKKGVPEPMIAKMDEATDETLRVVYKNGQVAIPKNAIDRLDYRPSKGRVVKESKTKVEDATTKPATETRPTEARVPGTSYSSGVSFGGKADFETIYRRSGPGSK